MILVVDNYDSFTYNLVQYLGQCGAQVEVRRNDQIDVKGVAALSPCGIMLSPGPCAPDRSGVCLDILTDALSGGALKGIPIFGVCLGHQAIGMVGGGDVVRAANVRHGKTSLVQHDEKGLFTGLKNPFSAIRYHSLVVDRDHIPSEFLITATSLDDGEVMGLRHESLPIEGVQFHPESVLTEGGIQIVRNFLSWVESA